MRISENGLKDFKNSILFLFWGSFNALYFVKDVLFTVAATILIIYPHFVDCPY